MMDSPGTHRLGDEAMEQAAGRKLTEMFTAVRLLIDASAGPDALKPGPRSSLAGDDERTRPFQVSHSARSLVSGALDHLHALANLVETAKVLHDSASFTLVRAALEQSATAAWLIAPASRPERISRRLRLEHEWQADRTRAERSIRSDAPRSKLGRMLTGVARENVVQLPGKRPTTTLIVRQVDQLRLTPGTSVEVCWRAASAVAHGRNWSVFLRDRAEVGSSSETGTVNLQVTTSVSHLVGFGMPAVELAIWAWNTLQSRATDHLQDLPYLGRSFPSGALRPTFSADAMRGAVCEHPAASNTSTPHP